METKRRKGKEMRENILKGEINQRKEGEMERKSHGKRGKKEKI